RAGVDISPGAIWALVRLDEHGVASARVQAEQEGVDPQRVAEVIGELRARELISGEDGDVELTPAGRDHTRALLAARRALLAEAVADESIDRQPELSALLHRLARELCGEPPMGGPGANPDVARVA